MLCARGDLSIACAVELDDASHNEAGRRDRDAFLAAACESAALPMEEVRAGLVDILHSERSGASSGAPWNGHRIPASKTRST